MKSTFSILLALLTIAGCSNEMDPKSSSDLKPSESTSLIAGYSYAGSREDKTALGGYGGSANAPKKVTEQTPGIEGQITLVVLPPESVSLKEDHQGLRLLLINRTAKEAAFGASDSRLAIICEARDQIGAWKPIEFLQSSFCGNSFHHVYLPVGHYWEFQAPAYFGSMKTKLRYHLHDKQHIYSNEFDGSINPARFKEPATPK